VKRGDVVTIALSGDYGQPRPALIIQSDLFDAHPSITVLPVTSELREAPLFRIRIEPNDDNGFRKISEVMVDKPHTVARDKIGKRIGHLDDRSMLAINRALAVFLGFA
jgi:mRNA interferase MazF